MLGLWKGCLWPPDKLDPLGPIIVFIPSGNFSTKSMQCAISKALSTSLLEALYFRLLRLKELNHQITLQVDPPMISFSKELLTNLR